MNIIDEKIEKWEKRTESLYNEQLKQAKIMHENITHSIAYNQAEYVKNLLEMSLVEIKQFLQDLKQIKEVQND